MSLLVLTSVCAMIAAAHGDPSPIRLLALVLGGGLACGGASALNHVLDRDIDRLMGPRTATRPVAAGRIAPARAVAFGLGLLALAVDRPDGVRQRARGDAVARRRRALRPRVHGVAQAAYRSEHRDRRSRGRDPAARRLGGRQRAASASAPSGCSRSSCCGRRRTSGRSRCCWNGATPPRTSRCCRSCAASTPRRGRSSRTRSGSRC